MARKRRNEAKEAKEAADLSRVEKAKKRLQGKVEAKDTRRTPMWKYALMLIMLMGGGIQVLMPAVEAVMDLTRHRYVTLDIANSAADRHAVFRSGQPWVVYCKSEGGSVDKVFSTAGGYATRDGSDLNFAVMDCNSILPSGKTVLERFDLNSTMFSVANGGKPQNIPAAWFPRKESAGKLVEYALAQTKRVKAKNVKYTKQLQKFCVSKKYCTAFLHYGKMNDQQKTMLHALSSANRNVRFVSVDTKHYQVAPIQANLPAVNTGVSRFPRVVFLKRAPYDIDAPKSMSNVKSMVVAATQSNVQDFIDDLVNITGTSTTKMAAIDGARLGIANAKKAKKPVNTASSGASSSSKPNIRVKDDVNPHAEDPARARARAESERRRQMDAEARAKLFGDEDDEYDEEYEDLGEDYEDEDVTIEL